MDDPISPSESTLVDESEDLIRLYLTVDSPTSTEIVLSSGELLYRVVTSVVEGTVTTVENRDGFVASLHWNDKLPDKVKIGENGSLMSIRKALNIPYLFGRAATFTDAERNKYEWRGYVPGQNLKLYIVGKGRNVSDERVATFHPSRINRATGYRTNPYLEIALKTQNVLDTIIWSFVFLEKNKRVGVTDIASKGDFGDGSGISSLVF